MIRGEAMPRGDHSFHASAIHDERFHSATGEHYSATRDGGGKDGVGERAAIERALLRQQRRRLRVPRKRRFHFERFVERQRLGGQTESMMQRDKSAQCARAAARKENFHRAGSPQSNCAAGIGFDGGDKFRIERQTRARQRHQRKSICALRRCLQHSRRGPGRFAAGFLAIEYEWVQSSPREFPGDRTADNPAADDDDVVRNFAGVHAFILSVGQRRARAGARLQRFREFVGKHARFLSQIAGADPILRVDGFVGLREEVADFFDEVVLRRIEFFTFGALEILLGVSDVRIGALLVGGLGLRREFRRDDRRRGARTFGRALRFRSGGRGRLVMRGGRRWIRSSTACEPIWP